MIKCAFDVGWEQEAVVTSMMHQHHTQKDIPVPIKKTLDKIIYKLIFSNHFTVLINLISMQKTNRNLSPICHLTENNSKKKILA